MSRPLRLAVLGDPIDHSRSPVIHGAALRHLGLDGSYEARRAGPAELSEAVIEMRAGDLDGINVTMPLKAEAAAAADSLTEEAARSGSVNTMRFREGSLEGHSTDVLATAAALSDSRFERSAPVLVLGSGGAAAAALAGTQERVVYLSARQPDRAAALAARIGVEVAIVPFHTPVAGAVLLNATPLGMRGETLPDGMIRTASGLIDLVYGDRPSPAVSMAVGLGKPILDGVEFLVLQAAASFEWWTGRPAPLGVMLQAARKH